MVTYCIHWQWKGKKIMVRKNVCTETLYEQINGCSVDKYWFVGEHHDFFVSIKCSYRSHCTKRGSKKIYQLRYKVMSKHLILLHIIQISRWIRRDGLRKEIGKYDGCERDRYMVTGLVLMIGVRAASAAKLRDFWIRLGLKCGLRCFDIWCRMKKESFSVTFMNNIGD